MRKWGFCLFVATLLMSSQAKAFLPSYDDDAEFNYCIKFSNDWDACILSETARAMSQVRNLYREILVSPSLNNWMSDNEEKQNLLQDMFESWQAYRTRVCSLDNVSVKFMPVLKNEEYSCNLYITLQHRSHLTEILNMLKGQQITRESFFLDLSDDHDSEYEDCYKKEKSANKCMIGELDRSNRKIKDIYKHILKHHSLTKWNNGESLKDGNLRDMFDSWVAYRNRMCSLTTAAYPFAYKQNLPLNNCVLFYNIETLERLNNILFAANSILDEEHTNEVEDDGGEAEGKKIEPLAKRIDSGQNMPKISLTNEGATDKTKDNAQKNKNKKKKVTPQKSNDNRPSWAIRN